MSEIENKLDEIAEVVQDFMDDYELSDQEPEISYTDSGIFITIHLSDIDPEAEDIDTLELETLISDIAGLSNVDISVELTTPVIIGNEGTDEFEDGETDDPDIGYHICDTDSDDDTDMEDGCDDGADVVVKELIEEKALADVVVDDSYEATEEDIQDLCDRFDDYTRMGELEYMGDWE